MRFEKDPQVDTEHPGEEGFPRAHGLLHQRAVDQLVEAPLAPPDGEDVLLGRGPRPGPEPDAIGRDIAELCQQVGDRLVGGGGSEYVGHAWFSIGPVSARLSQGPAPATSYRSS